jgi:hypothetical protein
MQDLVYFTRSLAEEESFEDVHPISAPHGSLVPRNHGRAAKVRVFWNLRDPGAMGVQAEVFFTKVASSRGLRDPFVGGQPARDEHIAGPRLGIGEISKAYGAF